ncbi:hypothetical protein [Haloarcula sp. JP-L23]|uniref:hypothetical protein n=1 Tax=Haloarcula sp. JP-L23 TaxID=2716717 RepID=UPI00140F304A|nr:hypothetical protein G9465_11580 [Haloarcula sp. JP-L23]
MTEDDELPEIPVVCTACDTRTRVPFEDVESAVDRHNEQLHDGDPVAEVDPDVLDQLVDRLGRDLGLLDGE